MLKLYEIHILVSINSFLGILPYSFISDYLRLFGLQQEIWVVARDYMWLSLLQTAIQDTTNHSDAAINPQCFKCHTYLHPRTFNIFFKYQYICIMLKQKRSGLMLYCQDILEYRLFCYWVGSVNKKLINKASIYWKS